MKFKWRKWFYLSSVGLLISSSLSLASFSIYYFAKQEFTPKSDANNLLPPPIFDQIEINQMTTPWGLKMDVLKTLVSQKTPAQINHYYINEANSSWKVNIAYSYENQTGNWIYELKYD